MRTKISRLQKYTRVRGFIECKLGADAHRLTLNLFITNTNRLTYLQCKSDIIRLHNKINEFLNAEGYHLTLIKARRPDFEDKEGDENYE